MSLCVCGWLFLRDGGTFAQRILKEPKRFYDAALRENWLVIFTHDHQTPLAYLEKDARGKIVARVPESSGGEQAASS